MTHKIAKIAKPLLLLFFIALFLQRIPAQHESGINVTFTLREEPLKIIIEDASGFSSTQRSLIDDAALLVGDVLKTDEFAQIITNTGEQKLADALLGPEQVLLTLRFYRPRNPFTSAVAYEKNGVIYLNPKAFNRGLPELAGTLIHEFTHTLGYTHPFRRTPDRDKTIPYLVGNAVAEIGQRVRLD